MTLSQGGCCSSGIAGAVPSLDFTLGDVVCANRVHDFSVRASVEGRPDEFNAGGGPMHPEVQRVVASLPAIVQRVGTWNSLKRIGMGKAAYTRSADKL
jgi:hypothetical protein